MFADRINPYIRPGDPFEKAIKEALSKYFGLYGNPIGVGRNRCVFRDGDNVVKVPLNEYGVTDNEHEACYGESYLKGYLKYARCHRVDEPSGLPIVIMEYVKPASYKKSMPDWVSYVDCQQVGYNKDGELVAYDYGLH